MSTLTKTKIPLAVGNLVGVAGILFAVYLILVAPRIVDLTLKLLVYLIAWVCFVFFPHCLAHYVVGRLVGVKFRYYSLGKSSVCKLRIPLVSITASMSRVLTLHVELESLQAVGRRRRVAMFSSGAVASMIFPFFVAFLSFRDLPILFGVFLLLLSAANLAFDLYFSPKVGDISKALSSSK